MKEIKLKFTDKQKSGENLILFFLYILGIIHWYLFLNYKNNNFDFLDWQFFFGVYLVFEEGIKNFNIPYHASIFSTDNFSEGLTQYLKEGRFLANEWINFMPQSLLLFFIKAKHYLTLQYFLFYSIMFYGLLRISKELKLSNTSSCFLIILFTYNGKLISQTAFGELHFVFGWMMIPVFYWFIYKFLQKEGETNFIKDVLKFSFIFFFILSQADMHIYYEMFVVGFLIIMFFPEKLMIYIYGFLLSIIISLWYVLPVLFFSNKVIDGVSVSDDHWRRFGISGYGHQNGHVGKPIFDEINYSSFDFFSNNVFEIFVNFFKYSVNIFNHIYESLTLKLDAFYSNTHEYNLYISVLGLIILSLGIFFSQSNNLFLKKNKLKIIFPFFLIFILSVGPFHKLILQFLNIFYEFNPIDGVPSRFMIFVLCFLIILSSLGFDKIFEKLKLNSNLFKYFLLSLLLTILWLHSYAWWIFNSRITSAKSSEIASYQDIKIFNNVADASYINLVNFSYAFSLISLILLIIFYNKLKRARKL